jgi:hypothetical protein
MKNLRFWLTDREADALLTLGTNPAAWKTFSARTWLSLASKGLVEHAGKPAPTVRGSAAITLTRLCSPLTRASQRSGKVGR